MLANARLARDFIKGVSAERFAQNIGLIYQVTRAIEIIGEAADSIEPDAQKRLPMLPWRQMIGMRHKLIHGYRTVRPQVLYETVRDGIPPLIAELERLLNEGTKS
jgi:uncharacterized protein with HEPN domain